MSDQPSENDPTIPSSESGTTTGLPSEIGGYAIRRIIASGGMGTVFEAQQEQPRRTVALKVMRAGMFSPSTLHRFQYEAQLLARLRHPCIAQIYDAGTHGSDDDEIPFFVMEYIPNAKAITEYAEEHRLGTREKIELFLQLCDAVHHGHQKGIVHRDLKPSNIVVDSSGHLKVIDFGVARAVDSDMAATADQTMAGQLVGSIQYMSPEQFSADPHDIDTRSDVYALGLVLYELLVGKLPYDLHGIAIHEVATVVREKAPTPLGSLRPDLRGDLQTIVSCALMKDRDKRYQSAHELQEDLRRFLAGSAINANPPTLGYQLQILARRNKVAIAGIIAVLVALIAGGSLSTYLYFRAESERALAELEAQRAQTGFDFISEVMSKTWPKGYGHEPTVASLVKALEEGVDETFANEPEIAAEIHRTLGWASLPMEQYEAFQQHCLAAVALSRSGTSPNQERTLAALQDLAIAQSIIGSYEELVQTRSEILEYFENTFGELDENTLWAREDLASAMASAGKISDGLRIMEEVWGQFRRSKGDADRESLESKVTVAEFLLLLDRSDKALPIAQEAYETARAHFSAEDKLTMRARAGLAAAFISQHDLESAAELYSQRFPVDPDIAITFQGPAVSSQTGPQLLAMWETWCPFSQRIVPKLEHLSRRFGDDGLSVVSFTRVNRSSSDERVRKFIRDNELSFPVHKDGGKLWSYFEAAGTPFIVLLIDGEVVWKDYSNSGELAVALVRDLMEAYSARG